jgi:hypothetical protein
MYSSWTAETFINWVHEDALSNITVYYVHKKQFQKIVPVAHFDTSKEREPKLSSAISCITYLSVLKSERLCPATLLFFSRTEEPSFIALELWFISVNETSIICNNVNCQRNGRELLLLRTLLNTVPSKIRTTEPWKNFLRTKKGDADKTKLRASLLAPKVKFSSCEFKTCHQGTPWFWGTSWKCSCLNESQELPYMHSMVCGMHNARSSPDNLKAVTNEQSHAHFYVCYLA